MAALFCSFCTKAQSEVEMLIAGPEKAHICNECVTLCNNIVIAPKAEEKKKKKAPPYPSPLTIKTHLDDYVIGQDNAKMAISVAVYNHYKRLAHPIIDGVEIGKSNVLLLGPSGSGKTLLAESVAKLLNVPLVICDATSLTSAGYVGDDVESVITRLFTASDGDIEKAEKGIVFIDEIDKLRVSPVANSSGKDVGGEGVQQALLKLIEGSEVLCPPQGSRKNPNATMVKVNTKDILFIVGGAFVGLDKVVQNEINKDSSMGFGARLVKKDLHAELMSRLRPEHLIQFGLLPEMVGRLPVLAALDELTEDQLMHVMTDPKNSIAKQFQKLFKLDGISLEFEEAALRAVAKQAKDHKTGARGLRNVFENVLMQTQFRLPELHREGVESIIITEAVITRQEEPLYVTKPIRAKRKRSGSEV